MAIEEYILLRFVKIHWKDFLKKQIDPPIELYLAILAVQNLRGRSQYTEEMKSENDS